VLSFFWAGAQVQGMGTEFAPKGARELAALVTSPPAPLRGRGGAGMLAALVTSPPAPLHWRGEAGMLASLVTGEFFSEGEVLTISTQGLVLYRENQQGDRRRQLRSTPAADTDSPLRWRGAGGEVTSAASIPSSNANLSRSGRTISSPGRSAATPEVSNVTLLKVLQPQPPPAPAAAPDTIPPNTQAVNLDSIIQAAGAGPVLLNDTLPKLNDTLPQPKFSGSSAESPSSSPEPSP